MGNSPTFCDQREAGPDILIVDQGQREEAGKETETDAQLPPDEKNKENTMETNGEDRPLQSRLAVSNARNANTAIVFSLTYLLFVLREQQRTI